MESNIYRLKLLNAILYFEQKTKYANITKIFKLLFLLDFIHFKQVGYPSIGLKYYAFEEGPVPKSFWLEIKDDKVPDDFKNKLSLITKMDNYNPNRKERRLKAKRGAKPDFLIFTPREIKILNNLVFMFKNLKAQEIVEIFHLKNQPWCITIEQEGKNAYIDYLLAVDSESVLDISKAKESLKEHFEIIKNFSGVPLC